MSTLEQKIKISVGSAAVLALVNLPQVYKFTNNLLPFNTFNEATGCPTNTGRLVHILVFALLSYLTMSNANVDDGTKLKHTIYSALIAYFVTSPPVYSFVDSLLGSRTPGSCPTPVRVIVQSLFYAAALTGIMYFPNNVQYNTQ